MSGALGKLGSKVGRARRAPGQLWQAPMFLLGLGAFILVAANAVSRHSASSADLELDLSHLRAGLGSAAENIGVLVARAENALARIESFPGRGAEVHFLAGVVYLRQSELCPQDQAAALEAKAKHHFEQARALGVAEGDLPKLQYRLGLIHFRQGDWPRAIEQWSTGIDKGADRPAQGYALLTQVHLKLPQPDVEAALAANQKQMEYLDDRNAAAMAESRLVRGELLLRLGKRPDALKVLERIGKGAAEDVRRQARLLQVRACADEKLWTQAIPLWKELLRDADKVEGGKARVLYELGLCHHSAEPADRAAALSAWQEAAALEGVYAQAAGLYLGGMRVYGAPDDFQAALSQWTAALAAVQKPVDYENAALPLDKVREILDKAVRHFFETQQFLESKEVALLYRKVAAPGVAHKALARASEQLAKQLDIEEKRSLARQEWRMAGQAYERAAQSQEGQAQIESFWRSAVCYRAAQEAPRAAAMLDRFVRLETSEMRLAEGWLSFAEVYEEQGAKEKALAAYYKCIEYPDTPYAYRARYRLAVEEMAQNHLDQAKAILKQNLSAGGSNADRQAQDESLFLITRLLYRMGSFDEAVFYGKQAVQLQHHPDARLVRELLADSAKKLADQAEAKMKSAPGVEARAHHDRTRRGWLELAAQSYQDLADELEAKARKSSLSPQELLLLRTALFGAADAFFAGNNYTEALRRYQALQEKYRKRVESLIACHRIWGCVAVMIETPEQSRAVRDAVVAGVKMARVDLELIPDDHPGFQGGGNIYSKQQWRSALDLIENALGPVK
ncbi:MAG: tetratricopeptide repeat protein [Gemmataceae bacterium]|nr:tetratricopeptide repeat protein [Gemmataceae bacterium]MCI0739731.1 tetratricopeptide repeat protein [Gemmataceae bacterium]